LFKSIFRENFNALKAKNAALRIELKSLNDQLTILLSKKKYKPEFPKIVNHASPNHQDSGIFLKKNYNNTFRKNTANGA